MREVIIFIFTFFVGIDFVFCQQLAGSESVKLKISPSLRDTEIKSKLLIEVSDSVSFLTWLRTTNPAWVVESIGDNLFRLSGSDGSELKQVETAKGISYIDRGPRVTMEETAMSDFDMTLNGITATHTFFPSMNGDRMTLSVKEKPFDQDDLDLRGRVKHNSQFDEPSTLHATLMATIAAGGGNTVSASKGVAWGAEITTSDFEILLPDNGETLLSAGVSVQNHSYGVNVENYYGIESKEYDLSCIKYPKIFHVFSAGNAGILSDSEGNYANIPGVANLTGQFKISKNTISVGAIDRFGDVLIASSRGPAGDGRIKPEVVAFGKSGSSESAAIVSGVALILQQHYKNTYNELPDAALIKALLINSANDVGRPNIDYETGFGNVNALRAMRTLDSRCFYSGEVNDDDENIFEVKVPLNTGLLKVTLAWNDPPAEPFAEKALINDLDLSIRKSNGDRWTPWVLDPSSSITSLQSEAHRGIDTLNNVEQITISHPPEGSCEVVVRSNSLKVRPQSFFVVYETQSGFEWLHPVETSYLQANRSNLIRWQWYGKPSTGLLEYRLADQEQWDMIDSLVDLRKMHFEWYAPAISNLVQFRMTVGGEIFESMSVPLSTPAGLQVGYNCDEEVMFTWTNTPGAEGYRLYSLGEKYLEPVVYTNDTFAIIHKSTAGTEWYTMSPVFEGKEGQRETIIDYSQQGVSCYFTSFLAREKIVAGPAVFDATLSSLYNLKSASLERFDHGVFEEVETITLLETNLVFKDEEPQPGWSTYRLKLNRSDGATIFSGEESIVSVYKNTIIVYPNPVPSGMEVRIIAKDQVPTLINLCDMNGKILRSIEAVGMINIISTATLSRGLYLLHVKRADGFALTSKLVVQ